MKNLSSSSPRSPKRAPARWFWVAGLLPGLLLAHASQAQTTLYNASGSTFYQNGDIYNTGTVENAGTYTPASGTLLVASGNFINSGTISTSPAAATLLLKEANTSIGRTLTLGGSAIPNLTLDVPAGTTMGSSGLVTGLVTFTNGHLLTSTGTNASTNDFTLNLSVNASLANETDLHYVKGRVAQARNLAGSFPIDYGKMGVTVNPSGNTFPLIVERRAGLLRSGVSFGVNPKATTLQGIDRVWALSSTTLTTPTNTTATMTLAWLADNDHNLIFTASPVNAQVWLSTDNGSTWARQGPVQNGSTRSVSVDITNLNAIYTVSTLAAPLPVELVAFTATKAGADGLLSWKTASERNSAFFEVQASANGTTWQALGQREAAGNSSAPRSYQFLDKTIARYGAPLVYYRLRLVDQDGAVAYSPLVSLAPDAAIALALELWPNPTAANSQLAIVAPGTAPVSVTVYDATGRLLYQQVTAPATTLQLPSAAWAAGPYFIRAQQGSQTVTRTLVHE